MQFDILCLWENMNKKIVISIDGPAGSGKSTIAKELSKRLRIPYLSTGSLYRALALKCIQCNLDSSSDKDAKKIADTTNVQIEFFNQNQRVILDGVDVTDFLQTDEISLHASCISKHKVIRQKLLNIQRDFASKNSVVMDGRDIGSVVLPMADFKFFLDADVMVRAKRRFEELKSKGDTIEFEEVLKDMKNRDFQDKTREISPLIVPKDAIVVDCTNLTIDGVVQKFLEYIKRG